MSLPRPVFDQPKTFTVTTGTVGLAPKKRAITWFSRPSH
jgi:hypothetical protein